MAIKYTPERGLDLDSAEPQGSHSPREKAPDALWIQRKEPEANKEVEIVNVER
jgi:hypothetical protein